MKICIVAASYYKDISENLIYGATKEIKKKVNNSIHLIRVPGTFEIPIVISKNIKKFDAFIALGCVIKGETPHFHYICSSVTNAIMYMSVKNKKPIGYGILTCLNKKQALLRSDPRKKNKGKEAALAIFSVHRNK